MFRFQAVIHCLINVWDLCFYPSFLTHVNVTVCIKQLRCVCGKCIALFVRSKSSLGVENVLFLGQGKASSCKARSLERCHWGYKENWGWEEDWELSNGGRLVYRNDLELIRVLLRGGWFIHVIISQLSSQSHISCLTSPRDGCVFDLVHSPCTGVSPLPQSFHHAPLFFLLCVWSMAASARCCSCCGLCFL